MAIGHARYSTVGKGGITDVQPFISNYPRGVGMAHNGNVVNYFELRVTCCELVYIGYKTKNPLKAVKLTTDLLSIKKKQKQL